MTDRSDSSLEMSVATLEFDSQQDSYLSDHAVRGVSVVSGASMIAALYATDSKRYQQLTTLSFDNMLPVSGASAATLFVRPNGDGVSLTDESGRTVYAVMQSVNDPSVSLSTPLVDRPSVPAQNKSQFYLGLHNHGNEYGPGFSGSCFDINRRAVRHRQLAGARLASQCDSTINDAN